MSVLKTFDDRLDVTSVTTGQVANGIANLLYYYGVMFLAGICFLMILPVLLVLAFFAFLVPRILGIPMWSTSLHRVSGNRPKTLLFK